MTGCANRLIKVRTGSRTPPAAAYLSLENGHTGAVNVYLIAKTTEVFLRQVKARTRETFPVHGVETGTLVSLRAKAVDGQQSWVRDSVALADTIRWNLR
jgi:hypothetical protein